MFKIFVEIPGLINHRVNECRSGLKS